MIWPQRQRILHPSLRLAGVSLLGLALGAGCGREEIRAYRVPKEKPPTAVAHGELPRILWTTPAGWEELPASGLRVGRFSIPNPAGRTGDGSVIVLAGVTGKDGDIVNLWRSELQLDPLDPPEARASGQDVSIGAHRGNFYDLVSTAAIVESGARGRILAALLEHSGATWCFKIAGEDAFVAAQKTAFTEFLRSVSFGPATAATALAGAPTRGRSTNGDDSSSPPSRPQWTVPAAWSEQPPSAMLLAKFIATGEQDAKAEITVSAFPGDVGGLLANINRWRDQVSLPPVQASQLDGLVTSLDASGVKATLVDLSGTDKKTSQPARLVGAVVPRDGQTWFYKLMGHPTVAEREKKSFTKFVQSARYSNP